MSDTKSDDLPIVTLRTMPGPEALESAQRDSAAEPIEPAALAATMARYNNVLAKLEEETDEAGSDVLITVQDRDASMLQSYIAEHAEAGRPLPAGGLEAKFGEGAQGGDVWGWIRSWFDHIDEADWHSIVRPPDDKPSTIKDVASVAALSDWGTNLYGAPVSAASISKRSDFELLLHLGDIYYSGTKSETKERFLNAWPTNAGKVSRALNGNHEMYSGGFAYYDDILPALHQPSSYFAFENQRWLLVGLDTAHKDHELDGDQADWVKFVVKNAKDKKVVLFSHHQPFSRLNGQGPQLQSALGDLLESRAIAAWYFGHEHQCILYDQHPKFGLLGRCIGHGGIPTPRKAEVRAARSEAKLAGVEWKRLAANADSPSCVVLDGPNPLVKGEEEKFSPHGYLTLEFNGADLTERIHLPDGTEIFKGQV